MVSKRLNDVRKTISCCRQITRLMWSKNKSLLWLDILIGLLREAGSILGMVFPAVVIQLIVDRAGMSRVLGIVFLVSLALTFVSAGIEVVQRSLSYYSNRALNYLILGLNKKVMEVPLEVSESAEAMEQYDKAGDGLWESSEAGFLIFSVLLSKVVSFFFMAYVFSMIHWLVAVFVACTLLLEFWWGVRLSERLHEHDQQQSALAHKKKYIHETLFDSKTNKDIFLNGAQSFFLHKYKDIYDQELQITAGKNREQFRNDRNTTLVEVFRSLVIYGAAVARCWEGKIPVANLTLFTGAVKQMTYAVWQIMECIQRLYRISLYFEDYRKYMSLKDIEVQGGAKPDSVKCIEFCHVSYRFRNQEEYALRDVSFKVHGGQKVALIGDNGAGKSTLVKLLLRLYHVTEGDILLNGKSIYSYGYREYLSCLAPVFQDFMMYSFSVRENILFDKSMDEDALQMLLDKLQLGEKIRSLKQGVDTPYTKRFDEDGVVFSGGEEQKLALARAFSRDSGIMILDEPTASLDPSAEANIYRMVLQLNCQNTTLFVSHRMSTTRFSDKILVLEKGKLVEEGNHEELMELEGVYCEMFSKQTYYYKECLEGNGAL